MLSDLGAFLPLAFGFSDIGGGEILVVGVIALLLFGKSLPSVTRNLGRALAEFKRTISEASSEIHKEMEAAAESVEAVTQDIQKDNPLPAVEQEVKNAIEDDVTQSAGLREEESTPATASDTAPAPGPVVTESPTDEAPAAPAQQAALAVSSAAALDELARNLPPPTKIPPPVM